MDKLETELKNQRKPGFQPGVSGNPKGKPKGARCRVTVLAEKLMADNAHFPVIWGMPTREAVTGGS